MRSSGNALMALVVLGAALADAGVLARAQAQNAEALYAEAAGRERVLRRELDLAVREVQRRGGPRVEMTPKQKPQKAKHHHGKKPKQGKRQGHRKGRGRR